MKLDLQTMGQRRYLVRSKNDQNTFKAAKGYVIIAEDEWIVKWITWEPFDGKFKAESINGEDILVRANSKEFDVYKMVN